MAEDARRHLQTLGLEPGASASEIKQAYRELAAVWHPDRFANAPQLRAVAQTKMAEINAAYHFLKRQGWDTNAPVPFTTAANPSQSAPTSADTSARRDGRADYASASSSRPSASASNTPHLPLLHILRDATQSIVSVGVLAEGSAILAASGSSVFWWDAQTGQLQRELKAEKGVFACLAVAPNSRYVALANNLTGWMGGLRAEIRVCEPQSGRELHRVRQAGHITSLAFSHDGKQLAVGDGNGFARFWEADTGREVQTLPGDTESGVVRRVAYVEGTQAAKHVVTLKASMTLNEIALWEVRRARRLKTFTRHLRECLTYGAISDIVPSPDGRLLLVANNDPGNRNFSLHLWDAQTGDEIRAFRGHAANVTCVTYAPDGHYIASGSEDRTVRLWDAKTGKEAAHGAGHARAVRSVAFAPDGMTLISGSDDYTARVWRVQ